MARRFLRTNIFSRALSFRAQLAKTGDEERILRPGQVTRIPLTEEEVVKRDKFGRKQLYAAFIGRQLDSCTLALIIRGRRMEANTMRIYREAMHNIEFQTYLVPARLLTAATKYYIKDSTVHNLQQAHHFARGDIHLAVYKKPLLELFKENKFKTLQNTIPFYKEDVVHKNKNLFPYLQMQVEQPKVDYVKLPKVLDKLPWKHLRVIGAFIKEPSKNKPNAWVRLSTLMNILNEVEQLAKTQQKIVDKIEDATAHNFFQMQTVDILHNKLSSVVPPLETSLSILPNTLEQSVHTVTNTLQQVAALKESKNEKV